MTPGPDKIDIPAPELGTGWESDVASQMEFDHWDELDDISKVKKATSIAIHRVFGWIIPIAISMVFLFFVVVLGVYALHLILPAGCRWLSSEDLQNIHNMLFSGVVGGAVAIGSKTYFLDKKDD